MVEWLNTLWVRKDIPQKIEVRQLIRGNRGDLIFHETFSQNDRRDIEVVTQLANRILAACQHDCDVAEKKRSYLIDVIDDYKSADKLVRAVGPLTPERKYLQKLGEGDGPGGVLDDEEMDERNLSLRYIERLLKHVEWKEDSLNKVVGDLLLFQRDTIAEQRGWISDREKNHMAFFLQLQDALDRSKERDRAGALTDLKIEGVREAMRYGRNLLFGLFGPSANKDAPKQIGTGNVVLENIKARIDRNSERSLIDGFLVDCEKAGILPQLFGEWTEAGPVKDKPGIFTPEQFAILLKVRDGDIPPEAIDQIIPTFGGQYEITFEQIARAQPLIPDSIGSALMELKELRERRRAAAIPSTSSSGGGDTIDAPTPPAER